MTQMTLAARNLLAQDTALTPLLGRSVTWSTWIFEDNPQGVRVENTQKCLIVVGEDRGYTSPNEHNTMRFPRLIIDIWADPTRNEDRSVKVNDAKDKIEAIAKLVNNHFHTVDPGTPQGNIRQWGTAEQIAAKTGVYVAGSVRREELSFSPIKDSEGSFMGRLIYGVNLI